MHPPASVAQLTSPPSEVPWMEGYPDNVMARLEARESRRQQEALGVPKHALNYVLMRTTLWAPGARLRVAFLGGNPALHGDIAKVAGEWNGRANIVLDFGFNSMTGLYRAWSPNDTAYTADIRVAFAAAGHWSYVGRDSVDASVAGPGQTSLNLAEFDVRLPANWKAVVLHEFGHALGFCHEHQNPIGGGCDSEFQWEDHAGGPGVYTTLGRHPNYWPRAKVNQNLRQIQATGDYLLSPRDSASVMHYHFPSWMFRRGASSPCCVPENAALSAGDIEGLRFAYPNDLEALRKENRKNIQDLHKQLSERAQRAESLRQAMQLLSDG